VGSTQLAERLGSARYFELLRRFVDDLSDPVLEAEGEIYQYAGDEVVITGRWPGACAPPIACAASSTSAPRSSAAPARYERDFGALPRFRGGPSRRDVTAGELGDLRQQIVFVGDILNTAARLEEYAKQSAIDLVVSGPLLERLDLPPDIQATACGDLVIRGKARVAAFRLTRARAPGSGSVLNPATKRRFTRLTTGLARRWANHNVALALYFMHYNFVWSLEEIAALAALSARLPRPFRCSVPG
jgi:class 3 adenylate cyclase